MTSKIYFLENHKIFKNWFSKTYEFKYDTLKQSDKFIILDIDDTNLNDTVINNNDIIIFGWHGISINKYYDLKYEFYKRRIKNLETSEIIDSKIKTLLQSKNKYLLVQDLHNDDYTNGLDGLINYLNMHNFKGIITPYLKTQNIDYIKQHIKVNNFKYIHMPHHIDSEKFKDYNLEKKYDILIFGNDHAKYYPFRNRLIELLSKGNNLKLRIIPKHKNYFKYDGLISNENLSIMINESWLTLCTSSKYDYLLGKYFETSMSNSVVLGNMPKDGVKIWKDNFVKLSPNMTDEEIMTTIYKSLENKDKLKQYSQNMKVIMSIYDLNKFANKLYDLVKYSQ